MMTNEQMSSTQPYSGDMVIRTAERFCDHFNGKKLFKNAEMKYPDAYYKWDSKTRNEFLCHMHSIIRHKVNHGNENGKNVINKGHFAVDSTCKDIKEVRKIKQAKESTEDANPAKKLKKDEQAE